MQKSELPLKGILGNSGAARTKKARASPTLAFGMSG